MGRGVCKAFDVRVLNGRSDSCIRWGSIRRCVHISFLRWDRQHVSLVLPNVRCPWKRHDPDQAIRKAITAAWRRTRCRAGSLVGLALAGSPSVKGLTASRLAQSMRALCLFCERAGQPERSLERVSQKGTIPLREVISLSLRLGATKATMRHDDLSQGSDRFGHPGLDAAYLCPSCSMSGITLSVSGSIQSEPLVHLWPSQTAR